MIKEECDVRRRKINTKFARKQSGTFKLIDFTCLSVCFYLSILYDVATLVCPFFYVKEQVRSGGPTALQLTIHEKKSEPTRIKWDDWVFGSIWSFVKVRILLQRTWRFSIDIKSSVKEFHWWFKVSTSVCSYELPRCCPGWLVLWAKNAFQDFHQCTEVICELPLISRVHRRMRVSVLYILVVYFSNIPNMVRIFWKNVRIFWIFRVDYCSIDYVSIMYLLNDLSKKINSHFKRYFLLIFINLSFTCLSLLPNFQCFN